MRYHKHGHNYKLTVRVLQKTTVFQKRKSQVKYRASWLKKRGNSIKIPKFSEKQLTYILYLVQAIPGEK